MGANELQFKVSSALKSIIGKDLITNKYIAIFELVKNAFDAHAENVDVIFAQGKITIKDDGKGMSFVDIKDKWLFLAYSAKADATEDENLEGYRDKIRKRNAYAGAKGIGRFACDRLGEKLTLTSIKNEKQAKIERLEVFWKDFEQSTKDNFIEIKVRHQTLSSNPFSDIRNGTVLEVTELREDWTKDDIEKLKKHLAKLINPIQKQKDDIFSISITFDGKKEVIENFVFDKLALKTTQIISQVSTDGKYITTEM